MGWKSSITGGILMSVFLLAFGAALADVVYHYDGSNRLERVTYEDGTNVLYTYDQNGNQIGQEVELPPNFPSNPSIANGAVNTAPSLDLTWTGGDPDGDSVTYTVFLGTNSLPTTQVFSGSTASVHVGNLSCGVTYYWYVKSVGQYEAITYGPVWHFTTQDPGPPIKNSRTGSTYSNFYDAYTAAADGDTLLSQDKQITENFNAGRNISVTFDGGYNCTFAVKSGMTTIQGAPVISNGTVNMKNFVISN